MHEVRCNCGNPECLNEIDIAKRWIYTPEGETNDGWLIIDAFDMHDKSIELMIPPEEARQIRIWFIQNFGAWYSPRRILFMINRRISHFKS